MELALMFYFAEISENLGKILFLVSIASILVCAMGIMVVLIEDLDSPLKSLKIIMVLALVGLLVSALLPNKTTVYTMAAAYGVQTITDNPDVQKLAGNSLKLLNEKVAEYLKDGKE